MIQKNGYDGTLKDGPQSSWLGYSLLPKGKIFDTSIHLKCCTVSMLTFSGSDISFPLLFTENLNFDLWPYMLDGDDGLGTFATS